MKKAIARFLSYIYFHKYFPWIIYKPSQHKLSAEWIREALEVLEPGDILLRRMSGYATTMCIPGYYSHAGLYVGSNKVCHAVAEGVIKEDILKFFRTDAACVLRVDTNGSAACRVAEKLALEKVPYDYDFKDDNGKFYCSELINKCYNGYFDVCQKGGVLIPDSLKDLSLVKQVARSRNAR